MERMFVACCMCEDLNAGAARLSPSLLPHLASSIAHQQWPVLSDFRCLTIDRAMLVLIGFVRALPLSKTPCDGSETMLQLTTHEPWPLGILRRMHFAVVTQASRLSALGLLPQGESWGSYLSNPTRTLDSSLTSAYIPKEWLSRKKFR
jgi:hypothetical protein